MQYFFSYGHDESVDFVLFFTYRHNESADLVLLTRKTRSSHYLKSQINNKRPTPI